MCTIGETCVVAVHICRVCGDRASGVHYGVLCCEGCKGFFFRTIRGNKRYNMCYKPDRCLILPSNRSGCKFCRMQRCLQLGMCYEAVKMGRRKKDEQSVLKTAMMTMRSFQEELTLTVYTAYTNARKGTPTNKGIIRSLDTTQGFKEDDLSAVIRDSIIFSTTFAKQLTLFTDLVSYIQHMQIKNALLEMAVVTWKIKREANYMIDLTTNEAGNDSSVHTMGRNISDKLVRLNLTPVELSILAALILFCSDRQCENSAACKNLESTEVALLSALKFQLVLNHSIHVEVLPHIIDILCCLRGLTSLYLEDLLQCNIIL